MTDFERHFAAADGYIALTLHVEAADALADIKPRLRATREVFLRREQIYHEFCREQVYAARASVYDPAGTLWTIVEIMEYVTKADNSPETAMNGVIAAQAKSQIP